jgi:hypothetical protein
MAVLSPDKQTIERLQGRIKSLEHQIGKLERQRETLVRSILDLGMAPTLDEVLSGWHELVGLARVIEPTLHSHVQGDE